MQQEPIIGVMISIDCPSCGHKQVQGRAYDYDVTNEFGMVLQRTSWVECSRCKAQLISSVGASELLSLITEQRNAAISVYVPLVCRALAVISLLIGCFPFVGAAIALAAVAANRRPGLWRVISWIGFGIAALVHGALGVSMLIQLATGR